MGLYLAKNIPHNSDRLIKKDIKLKDSYLVLLALDEYIVDPNEYFPEDVLLDYI